jgi:uncharacterized protein
MFLGNKNNNMFDEFKKYIIGYTGESENVNKDGTVIVKGSYQNGRKSGEWTHFYDNRKLKEEGRYINGVKDGLWTYWFSDGDGYMQGHYVNGKRNGEWRHRENNGTSFTVNSKDGYNHGLVTYFDKQDRKVKELWFNYGVKLDIKNIYDYYDDKNEYQIIKIKYGDIKFEVRDATTHNLKRKYILHGFDQVNGQRIIEYYRGTNYKESKFEFYNGKIDGTIEKWYKNGKKRSWGIYHEGLKDWVHTEWYDNGRKKKTRKYTGGKLSQNKGYFKDWNRDGTEKCNRYHKPKLSKPMKSTKK